MREDMFKVIVERPRLIHGNWLGGGREPGFRQRMAREDVPAKVGMRASHNSRKWLNENLTPLRRFLEKQVGRPWNKVHAELLQGIDQRNTVQQHILTHVDNFVLLKVRATPRVDHRGRSRGMEFEAWHDWRGWISFEDARQPLFVDPRTGILRATGVAKSLADSRRASAAAKDAEAARSRRVISDSVELRCADGIWYEVRLSPKASRPTSDADVAYWDVGKRCTRERVYDVWTKQLVSRSDGGKYASEKRQLGHKELSRYGLNGN